MTITLYGIPNCDTVKKARSWLLENGVGFTFHDFKKEGLARVTAAAWLDQRDWTVLVNRKGTTWRTLTAQQQAEVVDRDSALALMLAQTAVIKRPVLAGAGALQVGFTPALYAEVFAGASA